jgi:hypothetical protein
MTTKPIDGDGTGRLAASMLTERRRVIAERLAERDGPQQHTEGEEQRHDQHDRVRP